tara:strand:+ start:700 stop:2334 length:1635 start_codon:yes stop_codon:yes gene_type:complete
MTKTSDTVISINTNKKNERKVFVDFVYNKYSKNETTLNDNIILNRLRQNLNDVKNNFVRLSLSRQTEFGLDDDLLEFTQNIEEIFSIADINNLDEIDLTYFNRINKYNKKRIYHFLELNNQEIESGIEYLTPYFSNDESQLDTSRVKKALLSTAKISILKNENLNLKKLNDNKIFTDKSLFETKEIDKNLLSDQSERIDSGFLFDIFKPFKSSINNIGDPYSFSKINGLRCGFLLEKYKLENDKFIKIAAKFFTKKRGENNLNNLPSLIEDEAVRYGQVYKYVLSDVYLYSYPDVENRFVLNSYLFCDIPYETSAIVCRENVPPPPPINISFMYNENSRELKINWEEPKNYQQDAKGYQILRRYSLDEPFELVKQLEGHSEFDDYRLTEIVSINDVIYTPDSIQYEYTDFTYKPGVVTIYALRTIDAHGFVSDYSAQMAILYDPFEQELIVDLVSRAGAKRDFPNSILRSKSIFFKNKTSIVEKLPIVKNPSKITLYITPEFAEITKNDKSDLTLDEEYQLTITKLNNMLIHKQNFKIKNFIIS